MLWYGYDITFLLLIPAMIAAFIAQIRMQSAYAKYRDVPNQKGFTGAQVAQQLLLSAGLSDIRIEVAPGELTDHYDPQARVLRLSQGVYNGRSIAAVSIAAHECGHALQHQEGYAPLSIRNFMVPTVSFCSMAATPLVIIGLMLSVWGGSFGMLLLDLGIIFFTAVVLFQLVTLPVEFNASKRAIAELKAQYFILPEEEKPARQLLSAAAMTYLASALVAIMNLLRLLILRNRRQ